MMSNERLNYYRGQLLNEDDFKAEQDYHIEALSTHNKNLHTWGIVKGLEVTSSSDKKHLKISEGIAIDKDGRQIIINKDIRVKVLKLSEQSLYLTMLHKENLNDKKNRIE